jgi:hypothetical protein
MEVLMNDINNTITPHPRFLETLFAYKGPASSAFKDVLGLYDISHIAISHIDQHRQLLCISSTPSLEFNLFKNNLWRYDKTYQIDWYSSCSVASWESLYAPERYDELYYLKQIKHHHPISASLVEKCSTGYVIYSLASHKKCEHTRNLFETQHKNLAKIGQYCANLLFPLFDYSNNAIPQIL